MRLLTLFTVLAFLALRAEGQAVITAIPDAAACPRRSVAVRMTLRLGGGEDEVLAAGTPSFVTSLPKGRFLVGLERTPPIVYDPTGRFVRSIGRVAIYDADADMTPRIEVLTLSLKRQ